MTVQRSTKYIELGVPVIPQAHIGKGWYIPNEAHACSISNPTSTNGLIVLLKTTPNVELNKLKLVVIKDKTRPITCVHL